MAEAVQDQEVTEGTLAPETKAFFDSGGKKLPEEKKAPEPEPKPEEKKAAPAAKTAPAKEEKKPESPKDPPDVELKKYQAAMNEERERRKEIAAQLKTEGEKRAALEERFGRFLKAIEQQEAAPPEFDKDPAGHLKAREEAFSKRQEEFEKRLAARDEADQSRELQGRFQNAVASHMAAFTKEAPDYPEAYSYVRAIRAKELDALGVPESNQEGAPVREIMLNRWEMQLAHAAMQLGKNPAAALYAQAQALGYKKAESGGGDDKAKLESLAKGQEAAKGLSGGQGPADLSLERIMQMDEDEMAALVRGKSWNKVAKFFK